MAKYLKLFIFCLFVSVLSLFFSDSVSALGVVTGEPLSWSSGHLQQGNVTKATFTKSGADLWVNYANPADWNHILLSVPANTLIPANSIVSFSVRYQVQNNGSLTFNYYGVQFEDGRTLINDSCIVNNLSTATGPIGMNMLECTYVYYNPYSTYLVDFSNGHHILEWATGTGQIGSNGAFNIVVGPPSYIQLTNDGLSASDRAWLQQHMPAGSSIADIEQAVEDAQNSHDDDQQDKYEEQAEDNETTINSDSSAAQSTATSLLGVVGQFISTLTSAQPTNCNLDGSLIPHLNLGNLNLCTYQMPTALTLLGSLVLIAFVVPLAYHTVKRMLALIGSFQS